MKKIFCFLLITILSVFTFSNIKVNAEEVKIPKTTGGYVTHLDSSEYVYINSEYQVKDAEFRACWVSPLVNDITRYSDKITYQKEILSVLDNMEYYNLNVMLFHIRIMNDALYKSNYSNWSEYYSTNPDWDALPWIIEECHKRGIEFHAWMNPYRVANGTHNLTDLAKKFPSSNMASNPENMLQGENSVILNPGIPEIKTWLVNVCMEVVNKYNVDAIHFDDYFYDYKVDDTKTRNLYNTENLSLGDFRRKQVDDFIENLSIAIRSYNKLNNKCIQLGISPSGVYRSGNGIVTYNSDGDAITNGSKSKTAFIHYDDYLYSDTLKWINEEWIDYILPQAYWAIEHPLCPFADLMQWWNDVVKYKKVNVYAGIGLYQQDSSSTYSWYTSELECYYQLMISNSLENVKGACFFAYKNVQAAVNNPNRMKNVSNIWRREAILPEIQNCEKVIPDKISNLTIESNNAGYKLSFDDNDKAKFYVIYRSADPITFSPNEVIDVIGDIKDENGKIEYTDIVSSKSHKYYYGVRVQSNSLTLGEGSTIDTDNAEKGTLSYLGPLNVTFPNGVVSSQKAMISFEKLSYPLGDNIKYSLTYSFDDQENKTINTFSYRDGYNYCEIEIPYGTEEFNVKLTASNSIGISEYVVTKKVESSLEPINGFTIVGDYYSGKAVTFIWNKHEVTDAVYTIEGSADGFNWEAIKEVSKVIEGTNYREKSVLLKTIGTQYYRVTVKSNNLYGYSEILKINVVEDYGELKNYLINNNAPQKQYILNEDDKLIISWDKKVSGSDTSIDMIMYSYDMKNWFKIGLYSNVSSKVDGTNIKYTIPIVDSSYKLYIRITSTLNDMSIETDPIEIYVNKLYLYYDEVSTFINKEQKDFFNEMDLFK